MDDYSCYPFVLLDVIRRMYIAFHENSRLEADESSEGGGRRLKKEKGPEFLIRHVPVVEYTEARTGDLQQIVLDKQSSGLFFRPPAGNGFSGRRVIWLVIQKDKEIRPLFEVLLETLLPVGCIGIGIAVLLELLNELP